MRDIDPDVLDRLTSYTGTTARPLRRLGLGGAPVDDVTLPGAMLPYTVRNALHEDIMRINDFQLEAPDHRAFVMTGRIGGAADGSGCTIGLTRATGPYAAAAVVRPAAPALGLPADVVLTRLAAWRDDRGLILLGLGADWIECWPREGTGVSGTRELLEGFPELATRVDQRALLHEADTCGTVFLAWSPSFLRSL